MTPSAQGHSPQFVDIHPASQAVYENCFTNVDAVVEQQGGERIDGWLIWEWRGILLEAIFHAVWRDPEGSLIDVTPQGDGETKIVFSPDCNRKYANAPQGSGLVFGIQPKPLGVDDVTESSFGGHSSD